MAYLRSRVHRCEHHGCTREAREDVITWRNELHGSYCKTHAAQVLRDVQQVESVVAGGTT